MIQRCSKCGNWCHAEKKDIFGRVKRLFSKEEDNISEGAAELGEIIGHKGTFRAAGKALNIYANIFKIPGEAIGGDKYKFYCNECSNQWGTDDDDSDQSEAYELAEKAGEALKAYDSIASMSKSEQNDYVNNIVTLILQISEHPVILNDFLSSLYDLLAAIYYFHFQNAEKAIEYANKSIDIWPKDCNSIALRGVYTTDIQKPLDRYKKLQDIIQYREADRESPFFSKQEFKTEFDHAAEMYAGNFLQIPKYERKYLVVDDELRYLPDSFLVLKRSMLDALDNSGLTFPQGYANEKSLYICHPYKTNKYLDAENYKDELFYDQLDELLEVLQCLGAKTVDYTDLITRESTTQKDKNVNVSIGGSYKEVGGEIKGEYEKVNEYYEKKKKEKFVHCDFPLIPDNTPHVYEGSVWIEHLSNWQTMARMRLRGEERAQIRLSSSKEFLIKENEQIKLEADFNILLVKGNIEGGRKLNFERQEKTYHEWEINVEFYPLSDYKKQEEPPIASVVGNPQQVQETYPKKKINVIWIMSAFILILLSVILWLIL